MGQVQGVEKFIIQSIAQFCEAVSSEFMIFFVSGKGVIVMNGYSLGGGEGVFAVSINTFSVIITFQSVGLVVGERVSSVKTSANLSLTKVRVF
jgi:putative effector of murein hydrolase LrgA (UPF0299 family)